AYCVDTNKDRIELINKGIAPIYEPGLSELIERGKSTGLLKGTTDIIQALKKSEITFICVGTPSDKSGKIDLKYIKKVSEDIGNAIKEKNGYHVISVKSTVIPGTTDSQIIPIIERISKKKVGIDFGVCMTPEFLKEGNAVNDFFNPDKIVIGGFDKKSSDYMYRVFNAFWPDKYGSDVFLFCDLRTAEMIKYANNSFLAAKISFINEMANLSEIFGVDIKTVSKAMGMDKRISSQFLNAGLGFGGSCFPKDVQALYYAGMSAGYNSKILSATLEINKNQPIRPISTLKKVLNGLKGKVIAVLGLAFKPNTDDVRSAPSINIIKELLIEKAKIRAYDPVAIDNFKKESGIEEKSGVKYCSKMIDALKGSDAVIFVTEWEEFYKLNQDDFINNMNSPVIIDGRRIFDPEKFDGEKIIYRALGFSKSLDFVPN
ncbi:MAG: UDP-glucose dehydrogenase family protein, partial [Promethearchaeota archaeon]